MKIRSYFITGILLIGMILVSCTPAASVPPQKVCTSDKDCVPATCCHPKDALNVKYGPDCSEMMCTLECFPGTLDCGQGEVKCISGECKVKLIE